MNLDKQQTKLINRINQEIDDLKYEIRIIERRLLKKRIRLEELAEQKRLLTHYGLNPPDSPVMINNWWSK